MVWGAISVAGKSRLHFVDCTGNVHVYVGILEADCLLFLQQQGRADVLLKQEYVACHTARLMEDFLQAKVIDIGLRTVPALFLLKMYGIL